MTFYFRRRYAMRTHRVVRTTVFLFVVLSIIGATLVQAQPSPLICFEDSVDGSFWRVGFSPDSHGFGGVIHGDARGDNSATGIFHGAIVPRQNGIAIVFLLQTIDTTMSGNWTVSYHGLLTLQPEVVAGGTRTDSSGRIRLWSWHQASCQ